MSQTATAPGPGPVATAMAEPGPLGRLARLAYRRRGRTVLVWVAALAVAVSLSAAFAGSFSADYTAPGSDSRQAQDLLAQRFPAQSGDTISVVVRSSGAITAAATRADVRALLSELGRQPHVAGVVDPYA